jgi:hypothetical protein
VAAAAANGSSSISALFDNTTKYELQQLLDP